MEKGENNVPLTREAGMTFQAGKKEDVTATAQNVKERTKKARSTHKKGYKSSGLGQSDDTGPFETKAFEVEKRREWAENNTH